MKEHPLLPLYCPFPSAIHSQVEELAQHTFTWARTLGLIADGQTYHYFRTEQHWRLMARAYPTTDFALLMLIADWNTWGFCLDDLGDASGLGHDPQDLRRFMDTILATLDEVPQVAAAPIFQSVADIWQRVLPLATPAWRASLRQTLQQSFDANIWEANNRAQHLTPNRAEYLQMRRYTGAWLTYVRFAELFTGVALPPELQAHPLLHAYLTAVNNTIVWANDLMSWDKEHTEGDRHNLVLIIQAERGCTLNEAMHSVIRMHNDEVVHCLALEHPLTELAPAYAQEFQKYIDFAHHFMRANLDWSMESSRYQTATISITSTPPLSTTHPHTAKLQVPTRLGIVGFAISIMAIAFKAASQRFRDG